MKRTQTLKENFVKLLLFLGGIVILATVFSADIALKNGLVIGKVFWFHKAVFLFSVTVFASFLLSRKSIIHFKDTESITLLPADIFIILFFCITLLTYNWSLNPEPEKILFGAQLLILWFLLRVILKKHYALKPFFLAFILITGLIEAIWGIGQSYSYINSYHSLFSVTGSFSNPGPYSGYLAIICPIALNLILRSNLIRKNSWWHYTNILYYIAWLTFISIIVILPAGMSRTAWISTIISCSWVGYQNYKSKYKRSIINSNKTKIFFSVLFIVFIMLGSFCLYKLKKDSAHGRFFMWKITTNALIQQPIRGTGLGGFPASFAKEQASYFISGNATKIEQWIANSPEYAFNEYLQIGLEQGIPGLICFLLWIFSCFISGKKKKYFGVAGGILGFIIFAFSSYPLQLPSFWILLIFLSAISITESKSYVNQQNFTFSIKTFPIIPVLIVLSFIFYFIEENRFQAYKEWTYSPNYEKIYPALNHKPEYLFEYAQYMSSTGHYQEALQLLKRASLLSADPMIFYMMGKNAQFLENYEEAVEYILHGITILPERIYPYYLLTKLYSEPRFYNPYKLQEAADSVLKKNPKVETTAIFEMRQEVLEIMSKYPISDQIQR